MGANLTKEERFVWFVVCPQSFSGLVMSGLFYGWGALNESINYVFNPNDPGAFHNQHGTFTGVIILCLSVMPMMPLRHFIMDKKLISEFNLQLIGMIMTTVGLYCGGIALQFKNLYILYLLCALPCGFGGLAIYQRVVFIHQLWFKKIGKQNLGAGVFGFAIGFWTVLFFLLSTPILKALPIHSILYIYATMCPVVVLLPLLAGVDVDASLFNKSESTASCNDLHALEENKETAINSNDGNNNDNDNDNNVDRGDEYDDDPNICGINPNRINENENRNEYICHENRNIENNKIENEKITDVEEKEKDNNQEENRIKSLAKEENKETPKSVQYTNITKSNLIMKQNKSLQKITNKEHTKSSRNFIQNFSNSFYVKKIRNDIVPRKEIREREIKNVVSVELLSAAASVGTAIDDYGEFDMTYQEIFLHPTTWLLTFFFTAILTPGWGIKLGSLAILIDLFDVTIQYATEVTAIYVSCYAIGRLIGGLLAEKIGVFLTYNILIGTMCVCLLVAPQTASYMPHVGQQSSGCNFFIALICMVGVTYGGCVALFYSIVFDIFGSRNYRAVFGVALLGFGYAVGIGGLSSAYSFSSSTLARSSPGTMAANWFYGMAGGCMLGLIILFLLQPIDFNNLLIKRLKKKGIEISYNSKIEKNLLLVDSSTKNVPEKYQIDSKICDGSNNKSINEVGNSNDIDENIKSADHDVINYIGNSDENSNGNSSKMQLVDQIPDQSKA